jgi:predicted transcriptional regulator
MKGSSAVPSITDILKKISDDRALTIFNSIALSNGHIDIRLREMNLSKRQCYSKLSGLMNAGLIRRDNGKYSLTLIGKIVYDAFLNIGKALSYYWELKAIESIEMSSSSSLPGTGLSKEERMQLINTLIDNDFIKDFLSKESAATSKTAKGIKDNKGFYNILSMTRQSKLHMRY